MLRQSVGTVLTILLGSLVATAQVNSDARIPARFRQADASRILAGVREYPESAVSALIDISNQPDLMRQIGAYFQTEPKQGEPIPEPPQAVKDAISRLGNSPEMALIGLESPRSLSALRELFRDDAVAARERMRELRLAYERETGTAAAGWEKALRADPLAAGEYRDLLTRFTQEQLKAMPDFAVIAVLEKDYYNAVLPDERLIDFARQSKVSGALSQLLDRWASDFDARRIDQRALGGTVAFPASNSPDTPLYSLSPSWRQRMWRATSGGATEGAIGLVPVILQPAADQPSDARIAFSVEEQARLWDVSAPDSAAAPESNPPAITQAPAAAPTGNPSVVIRSVDSGVPPAISNHPDVDERYIYPNSYQSGSSGSYALDGQPEDSELDPDEAAMIVDGDTEIIYSDDDGDGEIDDQAEVVYLEPGAAIPGYDDGTMLVEPTQTTVVYEDSPVVVYDSPSYYTPSYYYPSYGFGFGFSFGGHRSCHSRYYARPVWRHHDRDVIVLGSGGRLINRGSSGGIVRHSRYFGSGGRSTRGVRIDDRDRDRGGTVIRRGGSDLSAGGLGTVSPLRTTPRPSVSSTPRSTRSLSSRAGAIIRPRSSTSGSGATIGSGGATKRDRIMIRPRSGSTSSGNNVIRQNRTIRPSPGNQNAAPKSIRRSDATPSLAPRRLTGSGGLFGQTGSNSAVRRSAPSNRSSSTFLRPSGNNRGPSRSTPITRTKRDNRD